MCAAALIEFAQHKFQIGTMESHAQRMQEIGRLMKRLEHAPLSSTMNRSALKARMAIRTVLDKRARRSLDVIVAALGLISALPLMALVSCLIKLTDGGPVLYWQTRIGKWGRPFRFPKFRSMFTDAETRQTALEAQNLHGNGVTFKIKKDPRVTWIGRIIRKTSIDELPQLWSVLIGDMALVGPRPPLSREVARYSVADRRRLDVTPGITCIWQVSGRSDIQFPQQLAMDLEYIQNQGLWLDIKLLLRTVPAVITGRGAY